MEEEVRLLREAALAKRYGFSEKTLRNDRVTHQRIPFIKIGSAVFYDTIAVEAALAKMTFPKQRSSR